jgi:2',3'-cyclic-nucleotide 2'-phosphodiesterase (5'-nucleotidase family)
MWRRFPFRQSIGRSYSRWLRALSSILFLLAASALALPVGAQTIQIHSDLTTRNVRTEESNLANVIADALRDSVKADIAFLTASSFADVTISRGSATPADILRALEYLDDTVMVVRLTGTQVKQALEHSVAIYPQRNPAFLQVSGVTVTFDPAQERGSRIVSVRVGRTPLEESKTYLVVMPSPLANGALAYYKVWSRSDIVRNTEKTLEQVVSDYLMGVRSLGGRSEERLIFKK